MRREDIFGERRYSRKSNFKYKVAAVATAIALGYMGLSDKIGTYITPVLPLGVQSISSAFSPATSIHTQTSKGFDPSREKIFENAKSYNDTLERVKSTPFHASFPDEKIKNEVYRFSHSYFPAPDFETQNKGDENSMSLAILLNGFVIPPGEHTLFGELLKMDAADFETQINYVDEEGNEKHILFNRLGGAYAIGSEACYEFSNFVYTIKQYHDESGDGLTMRAFPHTDPYGFHYYDPDGPGPQIAYSFLIPGGDGTIINNTDSSFRVHTAWDKETGKNSIILEKLD